MLIGHYAPALVLQRIRPSIPLWALFVAAQAVDVLWGVFVLTGVEHARMVPGFTESNPLDLYDMPYSHGLLMTLVWSVGLALLWRAFRPPQQRRGEALILGLAVASHFVLDLVVHVPDLPVLGTHGAKWGFGLWHHRELALTVECAIFVVAALVWRQARENRGPRGAIVLGAMTALLVASYCIPPPPTPATMAVTGLAIYAACAIAAWGAGDPRTRPQDELPPAAMTVLRRQSQGVTQ
jgi:membrane-bound metal-dependent hydrolase YbcI (DUF457 family)